ncbi:Hypothetical predicted protein [Paramuricea clavata]|uniref:Uncharacterized protein n=1 Tax=Paramuricea clavata TaxID=317549 RepID=A0A7D9HK92_PARCT|nr:Hypothetical predicted protein [Paramuricea clavata]
MGSSWTIAANGQFLGKYFLGVCMNLDIFHTVQRVVRKIPKCSKYSSDMAKEYGLVFHQPGDIGKERSSPSPPLDNLEKPTKMLPKMQVYTKCSWYKCSDKRNAKRNTEH